MFIENYGENSLENEKYQTMFLYPRNEYPSIRCSVVSDFSFQSREILNDDLEEELQPPTLNMSDLVKEKKLLKGKVR